MSGSERSKDRQEPNGVVDINQSTLSFDDGTRTLTLALTGSHFEYYVDGVNYLRTTNDTHQITDVSGIHYFHYEDGVTLQSSTVFDGDIITKWSFIAVVYWDSVNSKHLLLGDERHGIGMSGETHSYLHRTRGSFLSGGGALTDFFPDENGDLDIHAQFGAEATELNDENILFEHSARAITDNLPIYYKIGTPGPDNWRMEETDSFATIKGTNRAYYNELVGGTTWQLTEIAANSDFVLAHIAVTDDRSRPFAAFMGQNEYTTLSLAREGAIEEINTFIFEGLPTIEFKFIGTIIYQTSTAYDNAVASKVRTIDGTAPYVDLREVFVGRGGSVGVVSDHGDLIGLGDDDHTQYALVDGTRAFSGDITINGNIITTGTVDSIDVSSLGAGVISNSQHRTTTSQDDHTQYARTDGTRDITGPQTFLDTVSANTLIQTKLNSAANTGGYGNFQTDSGARVYDGNAGFGTWQSSGTIDGYLCNGPGDWIGWSDLYLNFWSEKKVYFGQSSTNYFDASNGELSCASLKVGGFAVGGATWTELSNSWTAEPFEISYTGGGGSVLEYTYGSTIYYRFVPEPYVSIGDAFFTTFNDPTLSGFVAKRGVEI